MKEENGILIDALRHDDIGVHAAWFPALGERSPIIPISFHEHCISAFYSSFKSISDLENSAGVLRRGDTSIIAIGMWFIAIESYINSILRICCFFRNAPFESMTKNDVGTRFKKIIEVMRFDKTDFYSSGIYQKLDEFKCFRNSVFHDRSGIYGDKFRKTHFCSNPLMANQVDVMQAAIIAFEIFNCFRACLPGLELMPNIVVHKKSSFFHSKYDVLYCEVLEPFFHRAMAKHGLKTNLPTSPIQFMFPESHMCEKGDVKIIIRAVQRNEFDFSPSTLATNIGSELMEKIRAREIFDTENEFKIGSYVR